MRNKIFFIALLGFSSIVSAQNAYDWKNVKGYISVKEHGVVKNYIIISDGNNTKLIPINKDPSSILKNNQSIIDEINKQGGNP